MSGLRTVGMSQSRGCDSKERKKRKNWFELDLFKSQPRNWAEFIHEFIGRQWAGSGRSEERADDVIGVAKVTSRTRVFLLARGCVVPSVLGLVGVQRLACRRLGADPLWDTRQGLVVGAFRVACVLFYLSLGHHEEHRYKQALVATGGSIDDAG